MIAPTFNEAGNIAVLIERLRLALAGLAWRLIVVDDDSPDGTAELVKAIAANGDRIQCLRRVGRRGLAGAVIEGVLASASPFVAVIDADLQHDETLLPTMLAALRGGRADIVVGTRFQSADGLHHGLSYVRRLGSRAATWAAAKVLRVELSDPMSGFFMARRELVEAVASRLSPVGFKILFDIVASQPTPPRIVELSYAFAERVSGDSKLDTRVVADYAGLLLSKALPGQVSPATCIGLIAGVAGVVGHLAVLATLLAAGWSFLPAQTVAGFVVLLTAFALDVWLTRGSTVRYALAGLRRAIGLLANVGVANLVYPSTGSWLLAGFAGAIIGARWTYAGAKR